LLGLRVVRTYEELPVDSYISVLADQALLASDEVRFHDDVIATVAAETKETALGTLKIIKVEYEPSKEISTS
jgi:xanthine dehydrogenase molybdopterin-binding subunit B